MSVQNNYQAGYNVYLDYFRATFGNNMPVPTYSEWLYQNQYVNQASHSSFTSPETPSFHATSLNNSEFTSPKSPINSLTPASSSDSDKKTGKKKRERWTDTQTKTLVVMWKHNFKDIESAKQNTAWLKIKDRVNDAGPDKTMKQIKDKLRNLKDAYKAARDHNKKTGESPSYSPFYEDFDEVLGTRDAVNTPYATKVGAVADTENLPPLEIEITKGNVTKISISSKIRLCLNDA